MKTFFLSSLLLCSMAASSQRIKISEIDTTSNTRRIGTSFKSLSTGLGNDFALALRSEDTAVFIQLSFLSSCKGLIGAENALVFELQNGNLVVAQSKGLQVRMSNYSAPYEYHILLEDVKKLQHSDIKSVSFYEAGGQYKTKRLAQANKNSIQEVCNVFLTEYERNPLIANNTASLATIR